MDIRLSLALARSPVDFIFLVLEWVYGGGFEDGRVDDCLIRQIILELE